MSEIIVVYDHGSRICTFTSSMLGNTPGEGIPLRSAKLVREYFESHTSADGKVHMELSQALRGEVMDAQRTEVFFLIAAALMKSGRWSHLEPQTRRAFAPYIRARTAAAKVRLARLGKLREFVRVCRVAMESERRGIITADEALSRMTDALPPISAVRLECKSDPDIFAVLEAVKGFAALSHDPRYRELLSGYIESVKNEDHE